MITSEHSRGIGERVRDKRGPVKIRSYCSTKSSTRALKEEKELDGDPGFGGGVVESVVGGLTLTFPK